MKNYLFAVVFGCFVGATYAVTLPAASGSFSHPVNNPAADAAHAPAMPGVNSVRSPQSGERAQVWSI